MGLSISHDSFSAGYGKFQYFRRAVAKVVGIPLELMEGYFVRKEWLICAGNRPVYEEMLGRHLQSLPVMWKGFDHDPICILLKHSDCEGSIAWRDAERIAKRLEEIAPEIEHPEGMRTDWDFRETALQIAQGFSRAFEAQEDIEFT